MALKLAVTDNAENRIINNGAKKGVCGHSLLR